MAAAPNNSLTQHVIGLALLAAVALALPGRWGLLLAGVILLGYLSANQGTSLALMAWLKQQGRNIQQL